MGLIAYNSIIYLPVTILPVASMYWGTKVAELQDKISNYLSNDVAYKSSTKLEAILYCFSHVMLLIRP